MKAIDHIKENKGYYTLLVSDTAMGSAILGVTLALINLPIALAVTALNVGANILTGVIMVPKTEGGEEAALSASTVDTAKQTPIKRAVSFARKFRNYSKSCFRDPKYVVESAASGAGTSIVYQALLGMKALSATHSILFLTAISPPVGMAVGAAVAAFGLYLVIAGNAGKWKGIAKYYVAAFKGGASASHDGAALRFIKKFTDRPRVRKFVDNKWVKRTNDFLLRAATVEAGVFTLIAAPAVIVSHVAAMSSPSKIAAGIWPMVVAVNWVRGPVWHLISAGRLMARDVFGMVGRIGAKKKAAAAEAMLAPEAAFAAAASTVPKKSITGEFEAAANKEPAKEPAKDDVLWNTPPVNKVKPPVPPKS